MPARFHIELEDGSHWTPVGRTPGHSHSTTSDVLTGHDFQDSLAPARCSLEWTHLNRGEAVLRLPTGHHRLFVSRGFEYEPLVRDFQIRSKGAARLECGLRRWVDMPAQGYFSGDVHQHFTRRGPEDNQLWHALARAEDLHLINTMVLKHGENEPRYQQYAYGSEGTARQGHYVIVPGQEFRDNELSGHMSMAGISEVVEPISTGPSLGLRDNYPPFAVAARRAQEQGAVVGWAHGAVSGSWGGSSGMESVVVEAALGLIDFMEVVQFMSFLGEPFWYRLLGCGIPLSGVGGTDFPFGIWLAPWYPSFGQERTYVQVGTDFSAASWFEGIRRGNLFATNGPMIWSDVEGRPSGSTLNLSKKSYVRVRVRAESIYPLSVLQVVVNGKVVKAVVADSQQPKEIRLDEWLFVSESSWIAFRVFGTVKADTFGGTRSWPLIAHSGIWSALIGGKPVRIVPELEQMLYYLRRFRSYVSQKGIFDTAERRSVFLRNIEEALSIYTQRLNNP